MNTLLILAICYFAVGLAIASALFIVDSMERTGSKCKAFMLSVAFWPFIVLVAALGSVLE